ncbi:MAG: thioesterase family protein [Pseudomonadota bacterium]
MTTYTELLNSLARHTNGGLKASIPATWMQGRTTYGGLTAALCLEAARELVDDLPIRSAQVAFVGPVGGDVVVTPKLLRRGKNTAFVSVDLTAEDAVMAQCIFAFGKSRESQLDFAHVAMPEVPDPETAVSFFREGPRPGFTQNFNMKGVLGDPPMSGSDQPAIGLWLRNKDEATPMDATAVLAIADCPPPAALSMQRIPAPISSMTWMAEFLTETITTRDGWYFALSEAQTARNGYSSQAMTLWNRDGQPILIGRQTIAMFG